MSTWTNSDNINAYELIPVEVLKNYTIKGGLNEAQELALIENLITNAHHILEIGAGYGRVIEAILKKNPSGKIHAIEACYKFHKILQEKYGQLTSLHHSSIADFTHEHKFDLILWLWSGISDFNKDEQAEVVKAIASHLTDTGTLVIDTLIHSKNPGNSIHGDEDSLDQSYIIQIGEAVIHGYMPSPTEINTYAASIGAAAQHIEYSTQTNRKRNLYLIHKP